MGKQLFIPTAFEARNQTLDSTFFDTSWGVGGACIVAPTTDSLKTITVDFASDITNGVIPFQILWKKASYATTGAVVSTPLLTLNELTEYKKVLHSVTADGTAQVTRVTPTLPTTQLLGDTYRLTIVDTTPGTAALTKYHFEVQHSGTDYTVDTLIDAFVALINADANINVTASSDGGTATYLILTGDTKFNHFRVAYDGEASATITYTTPLLPPSGEGVSIKALETELMSKGEGITNKVLYPVKEYTYETNLSTDYDLGVFKFSLKKPAKHGMSAFDVEEYTLYIAEPATSATLTDLIITAANTLYDQGA